MSKLDDILAGNVDEVKTGRKLFAGLYVTKDALRKARAYASLARDRNGSYIECYGYLLGDLDRRSRLAYDAYLAPEQDNNAAHTQISGETVIKAAKEIREKIGKRVLGWWHSHCDFQTFHSGTDDSNHELIAYQIAPGNYLNEYGEFDFLEGKIKKMRKGESRLLIGLKNNMSRRLELQIKGLDGENPLKGVDIEKVKIRVPIRNGYAYSMVVNAIGWKPYTEIATLTYAPLTMVEKYNHFQVPLIIVNRKRMSFKEEDLKKDIKERIILPRNYVRKGRRVGRITGGKYVKEYEDSSNLGLASYQGGYQGRNYYGGSYWEHGGGIEGGNQEEIKEEAKGGVEKTEEKKLGISNNEVTEAVKPGEGLTNIGETWERSLEREGGVKNG